jgi:hypothetical protein
MSMHVTPRRRRSLGLAAGLLVLLALPGAAFAHVGAATVSCTGADFTFSRFAPGSNTVHYLVTVASTPAARGDFALDQAGGTAGALHVALGVTGTATVEAFAWWGPPGTANGESRPYASPPLASEHLTCAAPPSRPASPAPAPAPAAPAPVAAPAAPAQGVAGVTEAAPVRVAGLRVPSRCVENTARFTVVGRFMRTVTFAIKGRPQVTRTVPAGRRSVSALLTLRERGPARQAVTARVRFRNGARPVTLAGVATRCARSAVQPPFTG